MMGSMDPCTDHTCCGQVSQWGLSELRWGWGPLRPGNAPRTLYKEARNSRAEGTCKRKSPESNVSRVERSRAGCG